MNTSDLIVVGGGLVGTALAYGAARQGLRVTVLDEGDDAFRASRGNFGLVWVQGKGFGMTPYARWTMKSAAQWPLLAGALAADAGVDVQLRQPGGFHFCFSDAELQERADRLRSIDLALDGGYPFEMLAHAALKARLSGIGPEVAGASYTPMDGHVNPLKLLRALHAACRQRGVQFAHGMRTTRITPRADGFELAAGTATWHAPRVVLAAGLGNRTGARCWSASGSPTSSTTRPPTCARPTKARSSSATRWRMSGSTTAPPSTCSAPSRAAACAASRRCRACGWCAPGARCG
jgi:glycine/D-amino acid oxidase-like deaminating enzyme